MKDKSSKREVYVCVFVYTPVALSKVAVHCLVNIYHEVFSIAYCFVACTVKNVGLCNFYFVCFNENAFYNILNFFNGRNRMCTCTCKLKSKLFFYLVCKFGSSVRILFLFYSFNCFTYSCFDF